MQLKILNKDFLSLKTANKYLTEDINIAIDDTNLKSENITKGVEILGVTGSRRDVSTIIRSDLWEGTIVPNEGVVERVYINTALSTGQVEDLLSNLKLNVRGMGECFVASKELDEEGTMNDASIVMIDISAISGGQAKGYILMWQWTSLEQLIPIFSSAAPEVTAEFTNVSFTGWSEAILAKPYIDLNFTVTSTLQLDGTAKQNAIGTQNEQVAILFSTTPFVAGEGSTIDLEGTYDGNTLINNDLAKVSEGPVTPVPKSGYVDTIYFNTSLSIEETDVALSKLPFVQFEDTTYIYPVLYTTDSSGTATSIVVVAKDTTTSAYSIIDFVTFEAYYSSVYFEDGEDKFTGWYTEIPNYIQAKGEAQASIEGQIAVGGSNNLIAHVISIDPTFSATSEIKQDENEQVEINLQQYVDQKKIPLNLKLNIEKKGATITTTAGLFGGWSGTPIPSSGIIDTVYLNTQVDQLELATAIEELFIEALALVPEIAEEPMIPLLYTDSYALMLMYAEGASGILVLADDTTIPVFVYSTNPEYNSMIEAELGFIGWYPDLPITQLTLGEENIVGVLIAMFDAEYPGAADLFNKAIETFAPVFSITPIVQDPSGSANTETINLVGDFKGNPVTLKQWPIDSLGTPVPNSGTVETLYVNTALSNAEIIKEFNKLQFSAIPSGDFVLRCYPVLASTEPDGNQAAPDLAVYILDMLPIYAALMQTTEATLIQQGVNKAYSIVFTGEDANGNLLYHSEEGVDAFDFGILFADIRPGSEFDGRLTGLGWPDTAKFSGGPFTLNRNVMSTVEIDGTIIQIGTQNDVLANIFSITPFEDSALKKDKSAKINLKSYIDNKQLPLTFNFDKSLINTNILADYNKGRILEGYSDVQCIGYRLYFNNNLSTDQVDTILSQIEYSTLDGQLAYSYLTGGYSDITSTMYPVYIKKFDDGYTIDIGDFTNSNVASGNHLTICVYNSAQSLAASIGFIGWKPDWDGVQRIDNVITTPEYTEAGSQNSKLTACMSWDEPFERDTLILDHLYDGTIVTLNEMPEDGWTGECAPVPSSGEVKTVYFNTSIPNEEVNEIIKSLTYHINSDVISAPWVVVAADSALTKGLSLCYYQSTSDPTQAHYSIQKVSTTGIEDIYVWNNVPGEEGEGQEGWKGIDSLELNIADNILSTTGAALGYADQNSMLSRIISSTPFVKSEANTILMENYMQQGKLPLKIKLNFDQGSDTSDATATSADILLGETAYVNGEKIEGTIPTYAGESQDNTDVKDDSNTSAAIEVGGRFAYELSGGSTDPEVVLPIFQELLDQMISDGVKLFRYQISVSDTGISTNKIAINSGAEMPMFIQWDSLCIGVTPEEYQALSDLNLSYYLISLRLPQTWSIELPADFDAKQYMQSFPDSVYGLVVLVSGSCIKTEMLDEVPLRLHFSPQLDIFCVD